MAKSMTGYGRASASIAGKEVLCEVKSVNSRYLDCTVKVPRMFGYLEEKAKAQLSARGISRGKLDVYIGINIVEDSGAGIALDRVLAAKYINALKELRDGFGLSDDISVMKVAENREIFTQTHTEEDADAVWSEVLPVFNAAIDVFLGSRDEEGARLTADLLEKKKQLMAFAEKVAARAEVYTTIYRNRLEAKLRDVVANQGVTADNARILTECAIFADRTAIDEELVRLKSHFDAFDAIFASDEPAGRRLDFLLQEMNRETNTIGSKCSDSETTAVVIDMKCLLEKIREQIQNLE